MILGEEVDWQNTTPSSVTTATTTVTQIVSATGTTEGNNSGLSSGTIGGLVGGIVGGFLLLAGAGCCFILRRSRRWRVPQSEPMESGKTNDNMQVQEAKPEGNLHSEARGGRLRYTEEP